MDQTEDILKWWGEQNGQFEELGRVLPHIVIDKVPSKTDRVPTPVLVGAKTLQRALIGTADPRVLQDVLAGQQQDVLDQVLADQHYVNERWTPLRSSFSRSYSIDGSNFSLTYDRLLLPIRMANGRRMLFTHTSQNVRH